MSEIQKNIETQTYQKTEISWLNPEKEKFLKDFPNFDSFSDIMKSALITSEEKQKVLYILNHLSIWELEDSFLIWWFTLVDENWIKDFINKPKYISILKDQTTQQEQKITQQEKLKAQQEKNFAENTFEKSYSHIRNKISNLKEIFKDNQNFLNLLIKLEKLDKQENKLDKTFQKEHQEIIQELATYLSKDNNATKVFEKLQNDPDSYDALYNFLQNFGNNELKQVLQTIPPTAKEFKIWTKRVKNILDEKQELKNIYFPDENENDIKITWNIIEAKLDKETSKIVDTQTLPPKIFIKKYGYSIETKSISQESLNIRAAFTQEKIKITQKIENNSNQILNYKELLKLKDLNNLQTEINILEKKENKSIEEEIRLYELKQEQKNLDEIQEKINRLQIEIDILEQKLEETEKEFLKYYWESYLEKNTQQEARNTLDFLHNLWLTNIAQTDLQRIINEINRNQNTFNLSRKIDLTEWFSVDFWDKNQFKRQFLEVFKNIYKKMWIEINIDNLIAGEPNPEIENQSLFKQKLEDAWITKWWSLQIETTMKILSEKPESKQE